MIPLPFFFSPCPNDTFCFHALITGAIDTEGLSFESHLEDIEQLNQRALTGYPAICKVSYPLLPQIADRYRMLPCGGAMGFGNGPLLVGREPHQTITSKTSIAMPGRHTTAAFLLKFAYPQAVNTKPILFWEIADAILRQRVDAGVLIHEGRFVYKQQGLHLIADLSQYWERRTGLPVPLGGIAVSRQLSEKVQQKIARIIHQSVQYALAHPSVSHSYVQSHARELDSKVIHNHIETFVNEYTLELGVTGRLAVEAMFNQISPQKKGKKSNFSDLFVPLVL